MTAWPTCMPQNVAWAKAWGPCRAVTPLLALHGKFEVPNRFFVLNIHI